MPYPLLAQPELPASKFELEKPEGKQVDGSDGKDVSILNFPISTGLAGVSTKLQPGIMRELHWHADAAEWAFVVNGRVRTTLVDPARHDETSLDSEHFDHLCDHILVREDRSGAIVGF